MEGRCAVGIAQSECGAIFGVANASSVSEYVVYVAVDEAAQVVRVGSRRGRPVRTGRARVARTARAPGRDPSESRWSGWPMRVLWASGSFASRCTTDGLDAARGGGVWDGW